jgi:hypothetical protein
LSGERLFVGLGQRVPLMAAALASACGLGASRAAPAVIDRELLAPYVAALNAGDTERAWRDFTTDGYRASTNLIAFEAGQARNRDELGASVHVTLLPDDPAPLAEPGHPAMLRVTARWEGTDATSVVVLDLVDGPPWRIERTWAWPESGLGPERVY